MKEEKLLRKILEDNGLKATNARLVLFRLLMKQKPLSLAQLASLSKGQVNRVSVYRVIALFEKLGIVRRINIGWKYKVELSELFSEHHHHVTCLGCGKIVSVYEDETVEQAINSLSRGTGFTITSHQLELQGYCEGCQKPPVAP